MLRPLFLRHIAVLFHLAAQSLPVQAPRPFGTRTLIAQPIRRTDPTINAGPAHLKPPSRFFLASATLYKRHHALAQI